MLTRLCSFPVRHNTLQTLRNMQTERMAMSVTAITKDQARALLERHAFEIHDPDWDDYTEEAQARRLDEGSDHGRRIVHCMMSFTGADWDLHQALVLIDTADEITFDTGDVFGHCLHVVGPTTVMSVTRTARFQFQVPADAMANATDG